MGDFTLDQRIRLHQFDTRSQILDEMNKNAKLYGGEQLTRDELDSIRDADLTRSVKSQVDERVWKKIKDQLLRDAQSAELLRSAYPDLVAEVDQERLQMNTEADVSGMAKVKTDFFGSKRKAAQAKRDEVDASSYMTDQAHAYADVKLYMRRTISAAISSSSNDRYRDAFVKPFLDESLSFNGASAMQNLYERSDAAYALKSKRDAFFTKEWQTGRSGMTYPYKKDEVFNDIYYFANDFTFETSDVDDLELQTLAESMKIVRTGYDATDETADETQQKQAFTVCESRIDNCLASVQKFRKDYSDLFTEHKPSTIMLTYPEIFQMQRYLKVHVAMSKAMLTSGGYKQLTEDEQKAFREKAAEIDATSDYLVATVNFANRWNERFESRGSTNAPLDFFADNEYDTLLAKAREKASKTASGEE